MQFKEGTSVYTTDGQEVGKIERFVLEPSENKIIGLVVRKGFFFPEDKIIPVVNVLNANADKVTLEPISDDQDFPPFEEKHYVPRTALEDIATDNENATPLYYFPPIQGDVWYGSGYIAPQIEVKSRNVPSDAVVLNEGAQVKTTDGKHVGDIERLVVDPQTNEITHFAITKGFFFKEEQLIPAIWVKNVMESRVELGVNSKMLENLPDITFG